MNDDRIPTDPTFDVIAMRRAIELAYLGQGDVEPNPMVGCVVAKHEKIIGQGHHERFGGPHAEVQALSSLSAEDIRGSTIYVTLEPCTHFGKTPPCVDLLLNLKPARVLVGIEDPFPAVAGKGIAKLREAGIDVELGLERQACERLMGPYLKRQRTALPWVIAKWAMTLDGRMATPTGDSKWISSPASRSHAHATRGRVDAILVGVETALRDDPLLTARPTGKRRATRVILDSQARLPSSSQLARTAREFPTMVGCGPAAPTVDIERLRSDGCEVWVDHAASANDRLLRVLRELARRGHTNVLIDGGPRLLGSFFDQRWVDEVHVYVASKLVGGQPTYVPNFGRGIEWMKNAVEIQTTRHERFDDDWFIQGTCLYDSAFSGTA